MSAYYLIDMDTRARAPVPDVYRQCVRYDHDTPRMTCPLCGRVIEGSTWTGPYDFYVGTPRLPGLVYSWALQTDNLLTSQDFLDCVHARGLTGIVSVQPCRIFCRKKQIDTPFLMPAFAYSQKAVRYAAVRNEARKTDKSLPRCSLCMGSTREKDALYFDGKKEFDVFKKYDNCAHIYCTEPFRALCMEMNVPGILFRPVSGGNDT